MSTAQMKKAYRSRQRLPIVTSPIKTTKVKSVGYDDHVVNLPAVKIVGQPSIRSKFSEVSVSETVGST